MSFTLLKPADSTPEASLATINAQSSAIGTALAALTVHKDESGTKVAFEGQMGRVGVELERDPGTYAPIITRLIYTPIVKPTVTKTGLAALIEKVFPEPKPNTKPFPFDVTESVVVPHLGQHVAILQGVFPTSGEKTTIAVLVMRNDATYSFYVDENVIPAPKPARAFSLPFFGSKA